jgi:hypothetical protein
MRYLVLFRDGNYSVRGNSTLLIDGMPCTERKFQKDFLLLVNELNEGNDSVDKNLIAELASMSVLSPKEFAQTTQKIFRELLKKANLDRIQASDLSNSPRYSGDVPRDHLSLVIDMMGSTYVVNTNKDEILPMHPNTYWGLFTGKERRDIEQNFTKNVAYTYFDPNDSRSHYVKDGASYLNKYIRPPWRKISTKDVPIDLRFKELLNHLFNDDEKQICFVMDWLYRLLTARNETALVLNGDKGVGKNLLYAVAKGLVGLEYCAEATSKFGIKEFNSVLRDRVLFLIDEHRITKDKYNFLKASFNEYQTIEEKGVSITHTERIFVNYMIFHNSPEDMYLENSERRFSVMDITKKPLTDIWSIPQIEEFYKEVNNPESDVLFNIGTEILRWGESRVQNPFALYLGEKYQEILDCHVSPIIHSMINLIETGKDIDGVILGSNINTNCFKLLGMKTYCKGPRAKTLVSEYKYRGKYSLGEVDTHSIPWKLKVNPELLSLVEKERDL